MFVTPAIGARTTGGQTSLVPSLSCMCSTADQPLREIGGDAVEGHPVLLHGVAVPDGDGVVGEGREVDGDAEGGADLVLAAVPAPDRAGIVELHVPQAPQRRRQLL